MITLSILYLDHPIAELCAGLPAGIRTVSGWLTHLAGPPVILGLCGLTLLGCIAHSCWRPRRAAGTDRVVLIPAATMAAWGITHILKFLLGRYRPEMWLEHGLTGFRFLRVAYDSTSMPSGHATVAMAFLLSVSFFKPRFRVPLIILALLLALTRVIITAHYLSDVIAGLVVGAVVAVATRLAMRRAFARRDSLEAINEAQ